MKCTIGTASPPGPGHDSPSPNTLKSSITASVYIPPSATAPLSKPSPTADSAPPPDQHTNETLSKNLDTAQAMKARDELTTSTLRMTLAAVRTAEVAGRQARDLSDDDVLAVLTKEAKKRRE